ncbi:hypothetical protein AL01_01385 [Bombella intestini]|uniref:Uncharacterized protein n=1 Tax=Bombella intestini TaxID=1539051 RepID=A0A1S8GRK3_9PROT|nr:hypothetical protein [Bombella intestini]OOL19650.1 hypothetical protein AL01_01385 [Bombella intestini]
MMPTARPMEAVSWAIGPRGYDTRQEAAIKRTLVLGEIAHPDDPSRLVPIILREGRQKTSKPNGKGHGRRHIEFTHGQEIRDLGFEDALDFSHHIVMNHNMDRQSPRHYSRNLSIFNGGKENMREALHLMDSGDHYRVTTAYPLEAFMKKA